MIGDVQRHVLQQLDGTRDRAVVLETIIGLVRDGVLAVPEQGKPLRDPELLRNTLSKPVDEVMEQLAQRALLRG